MHAAVVRSFDQPPRYETFDDPTTGDDDEVVVEVLAAPLHPRVRSGASGRHYASSGVLPMIPGADGVARLPEAGLAYFVANDDTRGTMAERAVLDRRRAVILPDGVGVAVIAAGMNPAMSSWVALRRRVPIQPGQSLLILGATGSAGSMAVHVAKLLGAGTVIAAGRNTARLEEVEAAGADGTVALSDDPAVSAERVAAAASEVDVVLDYLWGPTATAAIPALLTARADRSRLLDWVQIGAVTGPTIELPSVALRSANLRLQGVGQGSVSGQAYLAEMPALVEQIAAGRLPVKAQSAPLAEVEKAWTALEARGVRTVFIP